MRFAMRRLQLGYSKGYSTVFPPRKINERRPRVVRRAVRECTAHGTGAVSHVNGKVGTHDTST